jgi:2',3'-cyclic-nucleotide 2'-phosphodiesterase (5'-nucleotidase family)
MTRRTFLATAAAASLAPLLAPSAPAAHARPARRVTLLHMADTHAQLETHPDYLPGEQPEIQQMGGFARLKTAIDRERAGAPAATFLVDSGDAVQGSGPAAWSQGAVVVEPLNALGLDAFVPGNWEVVYGPARFRELMGMLKASVIAYNFHETKSGARLFPPAVTLEKDGVRVAFIGIADPTTTVRQPPAQVEGLDSTRMEGLRDFVIATRQKERADLVVIVSHSGLTVSRQLAREIPEVDVILSGHTHERTVEPILEGKVLIVEPGAMSSFLGRLDLTLGEKGGIASHEFRLIPIRASEFPEDPTVKALVASALAPHRARMNTVVGETRHLLMRYDVLETSTDDFIADAVREISGADIGVTNGFRFGPPLPAGPITVADLWNMLPLDTRIKSGTITGRQLRDYLENELELVFSKDPWKLSGGWGPRAAGMAVVFTATNPPGKRVVSLKVAGREVKDDDRLTLGGCEREGEPMEMICRLRGAAEPRIVAPSVHDALLSYLRRHPVIDVRRAGRAVATDLPARVFSQDATLTRSTNAVPLPLRNR